MEDTTTEPAVIDVGICPRRNGGHRSAGAIHNATDSPHVQCQQLLIDPHTRIVLNLGGAHVCVDCRALFWHTERPLRPLDAPQEGGVQYEQHSCGKTRLEPCARLGKCVTHGGEAGRNYIWICKHCQRSADVLQTGYLEAVYPRPCIRCRGESLPLAAVWVGPVRTTLKHLLEINLGRQEAREVLEALEAGRFVELAVDTRVKVLPGATAELNVPHEHARIWALLMDAPVARAFVLDRICAEPYVYTLAVRCVAKKAERFDAWLLCEKAAPKANNSQPRGAS